MRRVFIEYSFFSVEFFMHFFFSSNGNENKLGRKSVCWINWCENQKTIYIPTKSDIGWQETFGNVLYFCSALKLSFGERKTK